MEKQNHVWLILQLVADDLIGSILYIMYIILVGLICIQYNIAISNTYRNAHTFTICNLYGCSMYALCKSCNMCLFRTR